MTASWLNQPILPCSLSAQAAARKHLETMEKPLGALGILEDTVIRLAGLYGSPDPNPDPARILLFASDHGVAAANVSPHPQSMTVSMVQGALRGQSAIAVMARHLGLQLEIINVGLAVEPWDSRGLINQSAGPGTCDIRFRPAMDEEQLALALAAGRDAVLRAAADGIRMVIGGEIGVGKSTVAAAVAAALLGVAPESVAGPGSGLDPQGMARKSQVIQQALDLHLPGLSGSLQAVRRLGGFDIAALAGAYIACGQTGIPAMIDGLTASTAALVAISVHPSLKDWLFFGHRSAEPGQLPLIRAMEVTPLLHLDIRMGEGTGATAAFAMLRMACFLQREISFFR
ncbi:MAG: Nicotinate-nucleotide--dimethylbenzimidazole phosphoribosyltransferase [Magnetococcales bacterium]|nr:Nicotinate-nucleotide--dimethylbenzimidazole phosphoribosyltransferase [Magnetococcales bacterium]HIJ82983.1 nicotinate-nucleotide--dimethylbenzimidazole phosphoribosyltransferase [Magnetococcales bacterium]